MLKVTDYGLTEEQADKLRLRAKTDLYFLGKELLDYPDFVPGTHQELCDHCVPKDPNAKDFKTFADSYGKTGVTDRLCLAPRGGFKSTVDMCDVVQWILVFPDIRILLLSGIQALPSDFVGEITRHFTMDEDEDGNMVPAKYPNGEPNLFQILFADYCIKAKDARATEFNCPMRKRRRVEPTLMAGGIDQNLSGWHFDILIGDDIVTNENSRLPQRCSSVRKAYYQARKMKEPFGFSMLWGTWYDEQDLYGRTIKAEEKAEKEGEAPGTKILIRAAYWAKPGFEHIPVDELREDQVVLWFPERLTWKMLMKEKRGDPETFATQYMNNPRMAHAVKFPREQLNNAVVIHNQIPADGNVFQAWDTAYSTKSYSDYTVGYTGLFYAGRIFVLDIVRGKFNEHEIPLVIAQAAFKWRPVRMAMEDSVGVRWLAKEVRREMTNLRVNTPIEFIALGKGTTEKSKEVKAKPAMRLLGDGRLKFSNGVPKLDEVFDEMEAFPKGVHDDTVCGLSLLVNHFGSQAEFELSETQDRVNADAKQQEFHEMIHGYGRYAEDSVDNYETPAEVIDNSKDFWFLGSN